MLLGQAKAACLYVTEHMTNGGKLSYQLRRHQQACNCEIGIVEKSPQYVYLAISVAQHLKT